MATKFQGQCQGQCQSLKRTSPPQLLPSIGVRRVQSQQYWTRVNVRRPKALRQTLTWHNDVFPDEVTSRDVTAWPQTWHMGKFLEFHPQQNFLGTRLTTMENEECLQKHQADKAKAAWSCVTVLYTYVHLSLIPHFQQFLSRSS